MVQLYEYQGKKLFAKVGIQVPEGDVACRPEEARKIARQLKTSVAVKAQIPTGRRWIAGAIRFADSPKEAQKVARDLLNSGVYGVCVKEVLVERKIEIEREMYMVIASDSDRKQPICIVSSKGGVDVESIAQKSPESIVKHYLDISKGLRDYEARNIIRRLPQISRAEMMTLSKILVQLYTVYRSYDCKLAEINPLVSEASKFIALDAKVEICDDAIFRHPDLGLSMAETTGRPATHLELEAWNIDAGDHRGSIHFVQVDPDEVLCKKLNKIAIGLDCVGTGAALTTQDELMERGYMPVNFADTSGNPTGGKMYRITKIILSQPHIQGYIFVSCISSQELHITARGIIKALKELYPKSGGKPNIPMVLCIRGAWEKEAHKLFEEWGISKSPWVRLLGSEATERDVAQEFHKLFQLFRKRKGT